MIPRTWNSESSLSLIVVLIRHDLHHIAEVNIVVIATREHEVDVPVTRVPHRELPQ